MNRFGALRQLAARKGGSKGESAAPAEGVGESLARASAAIDEVVQAAERAAEGVRAEAEKRAKGKESVIDRDRVAAELMMSLAERTDALRSEAYELARILERAAAPLAGAERDEQSAPETPAPSVQGQETVLSAAGTPSQPPPAPKPEPRAPAADAEPSTAASEPVTAPQAASEPEPKAEPRPGPEPFIPAGAKRDETQAQSPTEDPPPLQRAPREEARSEGIRLLATQMAVAGSSHAEIEQRLRSEFGVEDADAILAEVLGGGD